jgi:hypothetical protein
MVFLIPDSCPQIEIDDEIPPLLSTATFLHDSKALGLCCMCGGGVKSLRVAHASDKLPS